ncbi:MAG: hypothetical protein OXC67_03050 [Flavobacteriaceae bacterium]|nr:hypothetical protein [Flavobacteriaceae bacterium]MCY4299603.1 hypothetical protein [Flavobacteriaceae bacterium]
MIPRESLELFVISILGLVGWDMLNDVSTYFGMGFVVVMSVVGIVGLILWSKKTNRRKKVNQNKLIIQELEIKKLQNDVGEYSQDNESAKET